MVPTEPVRLIPGHPLASFIKFIPGVGLKSVQNRVVLQNASSASIAGTQDGPGLADVTTNAWASISIGGTALDSALYAGPGATIAWRGLVNGPCNANNIEVFGTLRQSITSPYLGFCLANNPTTPGATVYWNSAGTFEQLSPASTAIAGAINTYVASFTFGGAIVLYLNGVAIDSTTTNTSAPATYSDDVLAIGGDFRTGQSANYPNVTTTCADWWQRPLSSDEVAEWDALPFSMLERAGPIAVWDVGGSVAFAISAYEKILGESLRNILFTDSPLLENISNIINSNNLLQENLISENAQTKLGIENLSQKISEASISSDQLVVTNNSDSIGEENLLENNSNDNLLGEFLASINSKDSLPNEYLVSFLLKNEFLLENSSSAVFSNSALAEMNLGLQINSLQIVDSLGSVVSLPVILIDGYVSGGIVLGANFLDAPQSFDNLYAWARSMNRTLELKEINFNPQNSNDLLQTVAQQPNFKSKYTTDYLDYSWSFSDFGLSGDYLIQGNIINVTPSGSLGITSETLQQGKYFTIWVSGGTENTIYGITFQVVSNQGRVVIGTSWLPVLGVAPYNK